MYSESTENGQTPRQRVAEMFDRPLTEREAKLAQVVDDLERATQSQKTRTNRDWCNEVFGADVGDDFIEGIGAGSTALLAGAIEEGESIAFAMLVVVVRMVELGRLIERST